MVRRLGTGGAVAQLGERLVRNEEVSGSIPLSSTTPCQPYRRTFRGTRGDRPGQSTT